MAVWINPETGMEEARTNVVTPGDDFQYLSTDEPIAEPGAATGRPEQARESMASILNPDTVMQLFAAGAGYMLTDRQSRIIGILGALSAAGVTVFRSTLAGSGGMKSLATDWTAYRTLWIPLAAGFAVGRMVRK